MKRTLFIFIVIIFILDIPFGGAASADEGELIFELTEEEADNFLAVLDEHPYLRTAASDGRPTYSKGVNGGIKMSGRDQDWQSLDIRDEWMEDGKTYNILVEFEATTETQFRIMNTDSPYADLAVTPEKSNSAMLTYTVAKTSGQRGVRLTTHPQSSVVDYTVKNILIYEGDLPADAIKETWEMDIPSLYKTYGEYFSVGNIMEPGHISNESITEMFKHQYNAVTAENAMKPSSVSPRKGEFNFEDVTRFIDWAIENDIEVHGHTLVWHKQSPAWLTTGADGKPLTRIDAKANMEAFITAYAGHYSGRLSSWDVVNEVLIDYVPDHATRWRDALRTDSPWYLAYSNGMDESTGETPEDYIYDAFVFTRLAAPDAVLYLNDFNEEYPGKREAMASMTEEFNERWKNDPRNTEPDRLLIEGLGMQAHYWTDLLDISSVRDTIERFAATGARIAITELDIPIGSYSAFAQKSDSEMEKQARLYAGLFKLFVEYSDHIDRVTIWGKADHQSWRGEGYPVLFDGSGNAKPAFWSVIEALNPPVEEPAPTPEPVQEPTPAPAPSVESTPAPTPEPAPTPDLASISDEVSSSVWWIVAGALGIAVAIIIVIVLMRRKK